MTPNYVCALITPGEDLLYAFSQEKANEQNAWRWCFPMEKLQDGEDEKSALERLLRSRLSLEYTFLESLEARTHEDISCLPCVCRVRASKGFTLGSYRACRMDKAGTLLTLSWEEPFEQMVKDFQARLANI
jgi:hypothetical protein